MEFYEQRAPSVCWAAEFHVAERRRGGGGAETGGLLNEGGYVSCVLFHIPR
jgi:hypothetical protein